MYNANEIAQLIKDNFLGLSYERQLEILNMYRSVLTDKYHIYFFEKTFKKYMSRVKTVVGFKKEYSKLDNEGKKFIRNNLIEKFNSEGYSQKDEYEKYGYSLEDMISRYAIYKFYPTDRLDSLLSYFVSKQIDDEIISYYLLSFTFLSKVEQLRIIQEFEDSNNIIGSEYLPDYGYPSIMEHEFDEEMKDLLFEYYSEYEKMHPNKRMEFINYLMNKQIPRALLYMDKQNKKKKPKAKILINKPIYNNFSNK